jgi:hypothetical protein
MSDGAKQCSSLIPSEEPIFMVRHGDLGTTDSGALIVSNHFTQFPR